ncbi:KAP family P-loop domain protein [Salmonella enterica subsp. enterica]|uniref:KAP family P-loop domain protein n=1 Tax=Salmonella enterica I TaxID=59201 RepID=A0A8F6SNM1_SALET|nr:P-loop NTPase fold protein [Salmonella enterica]EKF0882130.1 KAP family P-loop domain protein [Salmonella enterica subsp. enterica]PUM70274.1 KAP family P-loop domain protein [Salmonella enterica subsp. enterica]PUO27793.1 KAP family P-loop domain protein [Salmonella enterica subsp. enterica]PUQ84953.1 KAP family P-loop domain protein [Salmonella enterica subsp. enterica]QXR72125.1 KAP family P-loop domain protein [Salmonella enterica subsp. enterica]
MWSDVESSVDYLNFGEVSSLAVDILKSNNMLPVSIGIFGNWGAGKSSLLKIIEKQISEEGGEDILVVNFDAWLYQGYDDARAALLEVIAIKLNEAAQGDENIVKRTFNLFNRVDKVRALGLTIEGIALAHGIPTGGIVSRGLNAIKDVFNNGINEGNYKESIDSGKEIAKIGLIREKEIATPPQQINLFREEYSSILKDLNKNLIVFIDNLDRCLPQNAIQTLEAIRLFLFLPKTAFVIAADEDMIRTSVSEYFKGTSARHHIDYLDKLIQVPIRVPRTGLLEIRSYLFLLHAVNAGIEEELIEDLRLALEKSLQESWHEDPMKKEDALKVLKYEGNIELAIAFDQVDRIAPIFATSPIIHGNPRIVKRLLNIVKMRSNIAKRRKISLDENVITKLVIFERCAGEEAANALYSMIDTNKNFKKIISELESKKLDELPDSVPSVWRKDDTTSDFILKWLELEPKLSDKDLRAAVYLSRETMPAGHYVLGLSPKAREALNILVATKRKSSQAASRALKDISNEEFIPVMEGIIEHLRNITEWSSQPDGFAGAILIADNNIDAAKILKRFIAGINEQPHWMNMLIKDKTWNK